MNLLSSPLRFSIGYTPSSQTESDQSKLTGGTQGTMPNLSEDDVHRLEAVARYGVDPDEFMNMAAQLDWIQENRGAKPIKEYRLLIDEWFGEEPLKAHALYERMLCLHAGFESSACQKYLKEHVVSSGAFPYAAAVVPLRVVGGEVKFSPQDFLTIVHGY
jgi:hypothetical protein